ncbi:MAG: peptidoglycan editing factor PgeF [Gammaproteobacteria bacterium]|nr:peptidoglycan editing factor PgeF [Gammaproteobacteria bacterium]
MTEQYGASLIVPDWPAPASVKAVSTTRIGGVSRGVWGSLNLGRHVNDLPDNVTTNRERLAQLASLPAEPRWLNQVHGTAVVDAATVSIAVDADASFTSQLTTVCVVMTADCLPALFCNRQGTVVAAAHAGWRGLAAGVLEQALVAMAVSPADVLVWLGPAIGPHAFEVGTEVRDAFISQHPETATAFEPVADGKWLADIYSLARIRLGSAGVSEIYGGEFCTFSDPDRFFSYRRDNETGRMASLIWLA